MAGARKSNPLAPFRDDILKEAIAICLRQPFGDTSKPRIAHLRGILAMQNGRAALAVAYLLHASKLDLSSPSVFNDLGDALARTGRPQDGISAHLHALTLAPAEPERVVRLAHALSEQGRHAVAACLCNAGLTLHDHDADAHAELADVLFALGRLESAVHHYICALRIAPTVGEWFLRLGYVRLALDDCQQALSDFRLGLATESSRAELHVGVAEALMRVGRFREALVSIRAALNTNPRTLSANRLFVLLAQLLGHHDEIVGGQITLAVALEAHGQLEEAASAYREAITRKPDCLRALVALARVHMSLDQPGEAIRRLETAVTIDPELARAHVDLGLALHVANDVQRGWQELAWQHHPSSLEWRRVEQRVWDGSWLDGGTVLLWATGSLADTVQFVRYAQFAKNRGAQVILECNKLLIPLVRHMSTVDRLAVTDGVPPPFDVHAPLLYFPALVTAARSFGYGNVPYLAVPRELVQRSRGHLNPDGRPIVGIAWAGVPDPERRAFEFASLSTFAPLASVPRARILSLQLGPHSHELLAPAPGLHVEPALKDTASIEDIAAALPNLDVLITVDPLLAHVAGALGRPVWLLVPTGAAWPWPAEGVQTGWYPTMRLFRQTRRRDWLPLLEIVADTLRQTLYGSSEAVDRLPAPALKEYADVIREL
jgi:tetratricopeptide (TPR) repeat protein